MSKQDAARARTTTYYCLCGEFALVMNGSIEQCPRRPTDGAYVLSRAKGRSYKWNAEPGAAVYVRRGDRLERQHRVQCARCQLALGYQPTPPPVDAGEMSYLLPGAVSAVQGAAARDALDLPPLGPTAAANRGVGRAEVDEGKGEDEAEALVLD